MSKIRILLLTNRDSDNVGDQIIEATVISMLKGVMANLGVGTSGYSISSRAAGIITQKYLQTGKESLLDGVRKVVSDSDVIVFGGAPLFNYAYQNFYRKTIKMLEIAQEYDVPVLFSSIGVEPFNADDERCQQLKRALNLPCVKQITTRDDLDSAQKYVEGTEIPVAHVADPAVFADIVFRKPSAGKAPIASRSIKRRLRQRVKRLLDRLQAGSLRSSAEDEPATPPTTTPEPKSKRVALVATRAGLFKDNRISFTQKDQRQFWLDVIALLKSRGYDYRLLTTGHFADEVFLDAFRREKSLPMGKIVASVNSPEELTDELEACAGVIAFRLHASITSYAYRIPSIGLSWNFKVPYFYQSVGYGARALSRQHWKAVEVVDALGRAMDEGVVKDEAFLMTVYETLFNGLKSVLSPASERQPYSYEELHTKLPPHGGTSAFTYRELVGRKMRRTYDTYYKYNRYYVENEEMKRKS